MVSVGSDLFQQHSTACGEAMSVKAERPLKDVIQATFVEVPRNGMVSVGPRMARMKAAPKKLNEEAARVSDRPSEKARRLRLED